MTTLHRREFVKVSSTALGGFMIAPWSSGERGRVPQDPAQLNAFVRIEADDRVVIGARTCEIGQGVITALPMLIAEELDVPWDRVRVEQVPYGLVAASNAQGFAMRYGAQGAGGSTSIPDAWNELRQVGAQARWLLIQAAAQRWSVPPDVLTASEGVVTHPDGRRATYGDLAAAAARLPPPSTPLPLKAASDFRVIGHPSRTVDTAAIVRGAARYGMDADIHGTLVAVIERSPWMDGTVARLDATAALRVPGVRHVVRIDGPRAGEPIADNLAAGVAVVADDTWSAIKGRRALVIEWARGAGVADSTAVLERQARDALTREGAVVRSDGDCAAAVRGAARVIEGTYTVPLLAHATMEPPNCTVHLERDRARVICSTQNPGDISRLVSRLTGIPRPGIAIELPRSGGGFGRRLRNDFVAEAVKVAQQVQAPVKVIWTREDDLQHDFYRPFGSHALRASVDAAGRVTSWSHHVAATPRPYRDPDMGQEAPHAGTVDPDAYPAGTVPNYESRFSALTFGQPMGWWRAPLHTFGAFATESFVDELAGALRRDPVELRLELLGPARQLPYRDHGGPRFDTGRLAHVLREAARIVNWSTPVASGRGRGIACHFTFGGYAAHAMEVSVRDGALAIHRCVCVVDVGQPVNPLGLEAQMMGGTIDGISTALGLQVTVEDGRVQQRNFPDYPLLRMAQAPDVEVVIVPSTLPPSGAGEMGIPSALPALTNAIAAATGVRIRSLPVGNQLGQRRRP